MASFRSVFTRFSLQHKVFKNVVIRRHLMTSSNCLAPTEKVTHTGQAFDEGDYRKIRYIEREKEVNEQFAIDLISEEPPKEVESTTVWCDGGDPSTGHPKVFINLDQPGPHACGYCGLRYIHKAH